MMARFRTSLYSLSCNMNSGIISIIGAGAVGATIAYAAMIRGLALKILLVDKNAEKAAGEALDLVHARPFVPAVEIESGPLEAIAGSDMVVVTAGAKQQPGQSRLDLAEANVAMFRSLIPEILRHAPEAWLLIVSNPVDVLTYAALKLSDLPARRVVGSGTVLDTARFRHLIAARIGVAPNNVHAHMVGEHGDSSVPLWSSARVGGVPLGEFKAPGYHALNVHDRSAILDNVRSAAGQIIAAKGATNWAVGLAVARVLEAYLRNEHAVMSVSRLVEQYEGVQDVCLSMPCVVSGKGASRPLIVPLSEAEQAGLRASAETVRAVMHKLGL